MQFLEALAIELAEQGVGSIAGDDQDIYVNRFNEEQDSAILLLNRLTGSSQYPEMPRYRMTRFRAIVRGTRYADTIARAWTVSNTLRTHQDRELSGVLFKELWPLSDPNPLPKSGGDYLEVLTTFETRFILMDQVW